MYASRLVLFRDMTVSQILISMFFLLVLTEVDRCLLGPYSRLVPWEMFYRLDIECKGYVYHPKLTSSPFFARV